MPRGTSVPVQYCARILYPMKSNTENCRPVSNDLLFVCLFVCLYRTEIHNLKTKVSLLPKGLDHIRSEKNTLQGCQN